MSSISPVSSQGRRWHRRARSACACRLNSEMNVLLWVVQLALAFLCLAGGSYKAFMFADIANQMRALPLGAWRALGVFEMLCGVLLVVPTATQWMPVLTPLAAAALALES